MAAALLVDTMSGVAEIVGSGRAYALSYDSPPSILEPGKPLSWRGITAFRLSAGDLFDFYKWIPLNQNHKPYTLDVAAGVLSSSDGSIY